MKIFCNSIDSDEFDAEEFEIQGTWLIGCKSDKKEIHVPDGVTEISYRALSDLKHTETVYLPDSVRLIDKDAFMYSSISKVYLPLNLEVIYREAFESSNIQEIEIPPKVKELMEAAFGHSYNLERVIMSDGVQSMSRLVFCWCKNLEYIRFSSNLLNIGPYAFSNC